MLRLTSLVIGLLLLPGCATSNWVTKDFDPSRGGLIKYHDSSIIPAINEANRKDAYERAEGHCGGPIKVEVEKQLKDAESAYSFVTERYLKFTCAGGH